MSVQVHAACAVAENWAGSSQEVEPSWRVQLGVGADGDLWEAMDLRVERMQGKVGMGWVRGQCHEGKRTARRRVSIEQAPERECQG